MAFPERSHLLSEPLPLFRRGTCWLYKPAFIHKFRPFYPGRKIPKPQNKFDVEELKATWSCPPFVIEKLMIQKVVQSQNFETLLDVLFWACHPKFVLVGSIWEDNEAFIQFLRENLMDREVVPACCDSRRVKCWRHYLKEVEVKYSMNHQYGDSSPSCKVAILSFKLTW
ncbi:hypothetical protein P3S68_013756 [Capsicum galapagoense]